MHDKLKPCPFCGYRAFIGKSGDKHWFRVYCGLENCAVNPATKYYNRKEYAIEVWNRRVNDNESIHD